MKHAWQFYLLACLLSWTMALPLVCQQLQWPFFKPLPFQHALVGLGPCMAAFIIKLRFEGIKGVRALVQRSTTFSRWWTVIVALLAPFILLMMAIAIDFVRTGTWADFSLIASTAEFPQINFTVYFFYNLFFFGFGEEVGWKGVILPAFQKRWNAFKASLLFSLLWALWHLPLFFYRPGYLQMDLAGMAGWFTSLLTGSILLTWLLNSSRGSILVCALFHATIDMAFVNRMASGEIAGYMGFLITVWGIVTVIGFGTMNLSNEKRICQ